jgi:M6 family metalloprotease-like protein
MRALNNQLLEVYARLANLPGRAPESAQQAATVIGQRANMLEALIRENPAEALSFAFSQDLLGDLARAFPVSASELETVGEWEGPIEVTVEDGINLLSHRMIHTMSLPGGGKVSIHFKNGEGNDLESGDVLKVKGVRVRSEIAAADGGTITGTSFANAQFCSPMGAQRSIVLLVNMPGTTPPTLSTSAVHDVFFGTSSRSVSEFWRENSYGQAWAEGDVKGWYTLDGSYSCNQYPSILDAAVRAADAEVDFSQYSRVFVIISGMSGNCGWAGIANVGCGSSIQSSDGNFTMSAAWMLSDFFFNRDKGVRLATHEGGHNLGLSHASTLDFGGEALGAPGVAGTLDEYGDGFSTMGAWNLGHYAAPHKARLGWMKDYVTVTGNGSFTIQPAEYWSTVQALKIQRGTDTSKFLWVEFRKSTGLYDSTLPTQAFSGGLIHYEDSTTGSRSQLLDFTPGTATFDDSALTGTWTDPYSNLSIGISSVTESALGVNVGFAAAPCVQVAPTVTLSPLNPSALPGENVDYTVSVTNNDSSACSSRTFTMSSLVPGAWPTAFGSTLLTVSAGSTGSTGMTKSVPAGTAAATYAVDAVATSANAATGSANVTVKPVPVPDPTPTPGPVPITVNVSVPSGSVRKNSNVPITATVMQDSAGTPGATVVFTLVTPAGSSSKTVITDSTGKALWNYKVVPRAGRGTYTVTAQATLGSLTASSVPATFVVE